MSPGRYRSAPVPGRPVTPYSSAPVGEATHTQARMVVMSNGSVYVRREQDGRAVWDRQRPPRKAQYRASWAFDVGGARFRTIGPPTLGGVLCVAALLGLVEVGHTGWQVARALANSARGLGRIGWRLAVLAAVAPWRAVRRLWPWCPAAGVLVVVIAALLAWAAVAPMVSR